MVEKEIIALLKKEAKIKAPIRLKNDILKEIKKRKQSKQIIEFSSIESFKGAGILLIFLIISSTFLLTKDGDFKYSFLTSFNKINNATLELVVLSVSVLFFLSVLDHFLSSKRYKL